MKHLSHPEVTSFTHSNNINPFSLYLWFCWIYFFDYNVGIALTPDNPDDPNDSGFLEPNDILDADFSKMSLLFLQVFEGLINLFIDKNVRLTSLFVGMFYWNWGSKSWRNNQLGAMFYRSRSQLFGNFPFFPSPQIFHPSHSFACCFALDIIEWHITDQHFMDNIWYPIRQFCGSFLPCIGEIRQCSPSIAISNDPL